MTLQSNGCSNIHILSSQESLKFLKDIPFVAADNVSANPSQHSGALVNLYVDTSATFLKVLVIYLGFLLARNL